jgi:hypothetical protein
MSILTADYSELIDERRLRSEAAEKERPTAGLKRLKWREIEELIYDKEIELLEKGGVEIG